jgi:hypothetical protein
MFKIVKLTFLAKMSMIDIYEQQHKFYDIFFPVKDNDFRNSYSVSNFQSH